MVGAETQRLEALPADARREMTRGLEAYGEGRIAQSEPAYRHTLQFAEQAVGATHPATAVSRVYLGEVLFHLKAYIQAEEQFHRAMATFAIYRAPEDANYYRRAVAGGARSVFERGR